LGKAEPLLPRKERNPNKTYWRKPGGGRPPLEVRKVLEAIFYALRTGIQWKALLKEFDASSAVYRYFRFWGEQGFFKALWIAGLAAYDEAAGIQWNWLNADGCMTKAPLIQETVGKNPTDRGKNGSKRHMLVGGGGVSLSLVTIGANRHDVSQLEALLDAFVITRPDIFEQPQHLCLDKGYRGEPALETVVLRGFIPISKAGERNERSKRMLAPVRAAAGLLKLPIPG
jgi:transposase